MISLSLNCCSEEEIKMDRFAELVEKSKEK
jgi:hypothetical protein